MELKKGLGIVAAIVVVLFTSGELSHGEDISNPIFYSGITQSGHSGLLFTRAGTSIAPGTLFVGLAPEYFDRDLSGGEKEEKFTIPLLVTYGLPHHIELAGRLPFVSRSNSTSDSGFAELDGSVKWSFLQQEGGSYPSLAAGATGKISFASLDKGLTEIDEYGFELFLSGTALIELGLYSDYAFSLYGEGRTIFNDLGNDAEEKHVAYAAGVLLPIPSYNHLGFMLEFDGTINRGINSRDDIIRLTPSFRGIFSRWSFTFGVGIVNPEKDGEDTYLDFVLSGIYEF